MSEFVCFNFFISLLGIHIVLPTGYSDVQYDYRGCYALIVQTNTKSVTNNNAYEECNDFCISRTLAYMALRNGDECYCVERAIYRLASSECSVACKSGEYPCGSRLYYSIYSIRDFIDFEHSLFDIRSGIISSAIKILDDKLTTEKCLLMCAELKRNIAQVNAWTGPPEHRKIPGVPAATKRNCFEELKNYSQLKD
ncbi:hypothetical protein HELRODRAFT_177634 [Helobdella robusta]|uniref:WSC domain-containing protein n=1 Tax=Helobdella robusta TaxID=6412 RepID=T1FBZ2_HELRO|nr:hypothetical protein HELRODRAFT_177634 [Helobdella robusta]ESN97963.1 hypothetical protein HELRODRAFT_177634 [Helobdella robusta]